MNPDAPAHPEAGLVSPEQVDRAAAALERGGLVLMPTETVYGVAGRADRPEAVAALRALSGKPAGALTVHLSRPEDAGRYVDVAAPGVARLLAKLTPGPVTLRLLADAGRIDQLDAPSDVVSAGGWVALRLPSDDVARAVLSRADGAPVVAIGARDARGAGATRFDAVEPAVRDAVSVAIDGGPTRFGKGSTVVEFEPDRPGGPGTGWRVVRSGVYDERYLRKRMVYEVLLVCTGNTCRSPMAAAIARDRLAKRLGVAGAELESYGYRVSSAGVSAGPGAAMTREAVEALRALGVEPGEHRSSSLTTERVRSADVIYAMTDSHARAVLAIDPTAVAKLSRLDPEADVLDPIGGDAGLYHETAGQIAEALSQRLADDVP
ncbi:MAG: Sua5/YciO/YrdC/YwlC family protein [Planctomycetota bacterium]